MWSRFCIAVLILFALARADYGLESNSTVKSDSTCFCTTVPCPVVGTNYLTEGGGALGTYIYISHNDYPVVSSASVTITAADLDEGTDTTSCTQDYSRSLDDDGTEDCDAGHILANRLGGPGNQPINIFPQDLTVNRGIYKEFEESIYDCIAYDGASSATLTWAFEYEDSTRTKPSSVTYTAAFSGGTCSKMSENFTNDST
mmetsp:Transcript_14638/g.24231  ORF Transcript_14638/g.24231 Transcript_14638/m.24231 type:complete len:201 (+) Transcript_14638:164-766(+)